MKSFLLLLFFTSIGLGQENDIFLYGRVSSDYDVDVASGTIWIRYHTVDNSYLTIETIDKDGYYKRKLPQAHKIEIETNYHDYYAEKVILQTGGSGNLHVDLNLIPKLYTYTRRQAITDIRNGKVQLITFDTLEYEWTRRIDTKKDFGFEYILLNKPEDDDFENNMEDYNVVTQSYLSLQNPDWQAQLLAVKDSIVHIEADDYGSQNRININELKVPAKSLLSQRMQKRLATLQNHYNWWYEEKLKDYTFNYIINVITGDKEYEHFRLLAERISVEYEILLPELIKLLTNNTEVGMVGYSGIMRARGLYPTEPIQSGLAIPYTEDDLFTVAGRANHLLKVLTCENFGDVLPNSDSAWLNKLQNRWSYWLFKMQDD